MSEPRDHSHSGFEPGGTAGGGPGAAGGDPGAAGEGPGAGNEARRFWDEYARHTRPGGQRGQRDPRLEPGNGHSSASQPHECLDWCPICRTADVLRSSAPPELRGQVQSLQRDALVTLRALLDAYIERVGESPTRRRSPVEDIPIE